jgi:two-component system LytT family response regulator
MTILIIEDEELVAISLKKLVEDLVKEVRIEGPLSSVSESRAWLATHKEPDLILSDIQLSDGVALDIFSDNLVSCPVIFTTAYNEYAIKAFKLNSIDYLLKPVDKDELDAALKKFYLLQSKFANYDYIRQMMSFFSDFQHAKKFKERFSVNVGRAVTLIPIEEIAMFIKEEIIYIINREGKRFITDYRSLDEVQQLIDPAIFYRANRQHIIHLPFIEEYRSDDTSKLTIRMRNIKAPEIIISKEKAADFRKWFD